MPVCVADFASLQVFAEWRQNVPKWAGKLWSFPKLWILIDRKLQATVRTRKPFPHRALRLYVMTKQIQCANTHSNVLNGHVKWGWQVLDSRLLRFITFEKKSSGKKIYVTLDPRQKDRLLRKRCSQTIIRVTWFLAWLTNSSYNKKKISQAIHANLSRRKFKVLKISLHFINLPCSVSQSSDKNETKSNRPWNSTEGVSLQDNRRCNRNQNKLILK